jgi:hypothetical protein
MEEWYTAPDIAEEVRAIPAHTITTKWEKLNGASIPVEYHKVFRSGGVVKDVDGTRKTSFDTKEYDWSIDWDSVNEPIDPALFDYRSLELPKGTYIADGRSGELVVLDIAGTRKVPAVEVDRGMSWTMIILLVNGVIVLTLMAMIISRGIALK